MLTIDDLAALFKPDIFKAEADQRFKFWTPLIALYSGARQNEIAQMDGKGVVQIHGVWCFRFITAKQKKYTEEWCQYTRNSSTLASSTMPCVNPASSSRTCMTAGDGHGQDVSKWYNRYRRKCGLNDLRNKDFHSFRHTLSPVVTEGRTIKVTLLQLASSAIKTAIKEKSPQHQIAINYILISN